MVAVGTSVLWSMSSILFTLGGRIRSSKDVNRVRILLALLFLGLFQLIAYRTLIPEATLAQWILLLSSGVVGLAIGDAMLFAAFVRIGPRLSMLILALAPVVTTFVAWFMFSETISVFELGAIGITISGVAFVVTDKHDDSSQFKVDLKGVLLGVGGMLGQAAGLLLSKDVMDSGFNSLSATYIRILGGAVALWIITIFSGNFFATTKAFTNFKFMRLTVIATIVGPVLGIWSMMYAISKVPLGIASTLMSLAPLFIIPLSFFVFGEKPTLRSVLGTVVALVGVAGLFIL